MSKKDILFLGNSLRHSFWEIPFLVRATSVRKSIRDGWWNRQTTAWKRGSCIMWQNKVLWLVRTHVSMTWVWDVYIVLQFNKAFTPSLAVEGWVCEEIVVFQILMCVEEIETKLPLLFLYRFVQDSTVVGKVCPWKHQSKGYCMFNFNNIY